uniref:Bifunctional P-450/NADPH-P450 reductase n=1 Tax=Mycobacterium riyadhense TaxID=486698 RepID=A0A653EYH7_9MYCO|nr:Bifunctional P-450/NADPH-P450 reductase [Mycobacterium riyadhense]
MTSDISTANSRFRFPIIGDFRTIDLNKPVQGVTAKLCELGSGMLEQPFGKQPVIFLADADLVEEVNDEARWQKHIGPSLNRLRSVLGDGLFTAHNDELNWGKAHNILRPAFTKSGIKRYHDDMIAAIRELLDTWNKKAAVRGSIAIADEANRLTLEIIGRAGMDHSFSKRRLRFLEDSFVDMLLRELAYADRHTADIPVERKAKHEADRNAMRLEASKIIEGRRNCAPGSRDDVLDALLQGTDPDTGEQLDRDNIINQILTFLVVGSDTSANAIAFALHFLATNPDIAARARSELDQHWPAKAFPNIGFDDVAQLKYLRCIVDETLRLWPAAPGYFREARQDTTIGNGKHFFRAGEWVFVHLIAAHRGAAWGPDANEFRPERFLPENLRKLPARTYKPFGTGPRACLGRQFAIHEILLTLAAVLHQYDLEPRPGYCLSASEAMTLKPVDLHLRLHRHF